MNDNTSQNFRLFLCGDVMLGRGIDQALAFPCEPKLYESFVKDAREYISLAESANGKIPYPVSMRYIWGDALLAWQHFKPDLKIINLETAITQSDDYWPNKGIHYRLSPHNINILTEADIHICTLGNNHSLDWGYRGLQDTLSSLKSANIQYSGAGNNLKQASQPAIFKLNNNKKILVFSLGTDSSGVPDSWAAQPNRAGVYYIQDINNESLAHIIDLIQFYKKTDDFVILSIHWGSNWGYDIPEKFRLFAHNLIDSGAVNIIFGHSSHHPRTIELYKNKPILYGCGDFINDYEGISGHEHYRGDLSIMYFLDFDKNSLEFKNLILIPLQIKNFKLQFTNQKDRNWLFDNFKKYNLFNVKLQVSNITPLNIPCFSFKA